MRVLVLGGDGMLGHQLFKQLSSRHECTATLRKGRANYAHLRYFDAKNCVYDIDVTNTDALMAVLADRRPDVIINCIGIVKQRDAAHEILPSLEINAAFPHRLAMAAKVGSARVVHFSTDCVFDGTKGAYAESDPSDAKDIYGRTKFLGELAYDHCITFRTSIIGPELTRHTGMLAWFLSQRGKTVKGFAKAIYTGFPTLEMARIVDKVLARPDLAGVFQVASAPISKFDLLHLIKKTADLPIEIQPDHVFSCDRSLNGDRFNKALGYTPPAWPTLVADMLDDLKKDAHYAL